MCVNSHVKQELQSVAPARDKISAQGSIPRPLGRSKKCIHILGFCYLHHMSIKIQSWGSTFGILLGVWGVMALRLQVSFPEAYNVNFTGSLKQVALWVRWFRIRSA